MTLATDGTAGKGTARRRGPETGEMAGAMMKRGWSEKRVRKVLGENWLAFLENVWGG